MRPYFLIFPAILLAACTLQQQNGNQVSYAPPLLAGNQWEITQQGTASNGQRVCAVSAGEMEVTQYGKGKNVTVQVATNASLNPGDYYRVIYANDVHETLRGTNNFSQAESRAILGDLLKGGTIYTEIQQRVIETWGGREFERQGNKISLDDFAPAYQECKRFISGSAH